MSPVKPTGEPARHSPKGKHGEVADRILAAARVAFARDGYHGTTLSAVATRAGVDPALVTYYFSDKRGLLGACLEFPLSFTEAVAAAATTPVARRGRAFMDTMLGFWEDPATGEILHSIFSPMGTACVRHGCSGRPGSLEALSS